MSAALEKAARDLLRYFCRSLDAGPLLDGDPRREMQLLAALRAALPPEEPEPERKAARLRAWETRRAKYGERGHRVGSYSRSRP